MTDLLYLQDTYLFEENATILERGSDEFWDYIILDRTIFYPQWGGQPSDTGTITSWEQVFEVSKCVLSPDGIVYHYGSWNIDAWKKCKLKIDSENRVINTRNHSAGHLLDVAMQKLWYSENLTPTKWYHFPDWAYVEYKWDFNIPPEIFIDQIEEKMAELIDRNIPIYIEYEDLSQLEAPQWKTPRYVYFEWYPWCWCWGTHVKNSWEILGVSLRKVKYKKGILRVSYIITTQ